MNTLKMINYIFTKKQKIHLAILMIELFVGSLTELLGVTLILPVVSIISDVSVVHTNKYYSYIYNCMGLTSERQFVILLLACLILVYIVKNIYIMFMYNAQYRFSLENERALANRLVRCYMAQPYTFHLEKNVAELQRNIGGDVSMFFGAVLAFVQMLSEIVTCVLISIYLLFLDKSITIGVVSILAVFVVIYFRVFKKRSIELGLMARRSSVMMGKWIRQAFEGIKEIKLLNRERYFSEQIDYYYGKYADTSRKSSLINVLPRPTFESICVTALLAVVAIKISRNVNLQYFIPTLSAFALAAFRLLPSFGRIATNLNVVSYNRTAINEIYEDLAGIEGLTEIERRNTIPEEKVRLIKGIKADNISFKYPNSDKYVLRNISIEIEKNKAVAFIGPSGAGKTTLADILIGILEPTSGRVQVDDCDVKTLGSKWCASIGYIPQSIYLIDDTIRNNIIFGLTEDEANDDKIIMALKKAQLYDFVCNLEKGIETVIGERGVRLSGGQRQRIGIARALYNDPDVLVLDEATASLDNETERAVMEAINGLHGDKTMIIIAHRLTTIANCDIVYKVDEGTVVEVENPNKT